MSLNDVLRLMIQQDPSYALSLKDPRDGEVYALNVTKETYIKAKRDKAFALSLIDKYKQAETEQSTFTLDTFQEKVPLDLNLSDGSTVQIMVTPEDCSRAQEDATFAQMLLEQNSSTLNLNNVFELENASENYQQEEEEDDDDDDDDDDGNESRESHGKKTSNTRKGNWSDNQTKLLLDEVINFKEIHKTLNHQNFHKHLSEALKEYGHHFSPKQVMHRLNNLKKKLKKIKDHNSKTGNNQKTWIHYETMYDIYKEHPWLTPKNTIASDAGDIAMEESGPSRCSRKRKLDDENLNFKTKFLELQEKKLDDVRDYRGKKLEILKEFVNKKK